MAHQEWLPLWENDDERFAAYAAAPDDIKAEMRAEYGDYIKRTYPVGALATETAQQSDESSVNA